MNREDIKEQLTNKARDLAQNSVTKKNYVEIVRNDEFLDLLDKLMKQSPNVVKKATKPTMAKYQPVEELTTKIPFAPIAFDQYEPVRLGEYVETKSELQDILDIAQNKEIPNILIEAGKGTGAHRRVLSGYRITRQRFSWDRRERLHASIRRVGR